MAKARKWIVYIIKTTSGKLYTGITTDLQRRFKGHSTGTSGAKFFRISKAQEICYQEISENRSQATKREIEIKKMTRKEKLILIQSS